MCAEIRRSFICLWATSSINERKLEYSTHMNYGSNYKSIKFTRGSGKLNCQKSGRQIKGTKKSSGKLCSGLEAFVFVLCAWNVENSGKCRENDYRTAQQVAAFDAAENVETWALESNWREGRTSALLSENSERTAREEVAVTGATRVALRESDANALIVSRCNPMPHLSSRWFRATGALHLTPTSPADQRFQFVTNCPVFYVWHTHTLAHLHSFNLCSSGPMTLSCVISICNSLCYYTVSISIKQSYLYANGTTNWERTQLANPRRREWAYS